MTECIVEGWPKCHGLKNKTKLRKIRVEKIKCFAKWYNI